jgi:hypothetical protein
MNRLRATVDSLVELLFVAKTTVTTVWFWVPIAYALYFIAQLWLIFYVHPLTAFAAATILGVYALYLEEKRATARYSLKKTAFLSVTHSFSEGPKPVDEQESEVERTVEEYERLLRKADKFSS